MSRSLKVDEKFINKVKAAVQRRTPPRQKDLAEELGLSLATVSNFLNGRPIDCINFQEICNKLNLDWETIVVHNLNSEDTIITETVVDSSILLPVNVEPPDDKLEINNFIYVERPPIEPTCYQTLRQPGALLRIKAAGWMGKTSLIARIFPQLEHEGYRVVCLNLHYAETNQFTSLNKFLQWFCISVGQLLGIPNRLADYWDEQFSTSKMNCTAYFEEYLLPQTVNPLILCLDEVERIFPHPEIASDFLGLLRAWHEQANIRRIWKQLRLVVVHSTEVYVPLKVDQSPFNVGVPIELPEFTNLQVQYLAQQYGLSWDLTEVKRLMDMVGGHPYLVKQAISLLKTNKSVTLSQILETAATESGIYGSYLRRYWNILQKDSELAEALKKVVTQTNKVYLESVQSYKLHSMGLVHLSGNEVKIACNLYRQYFSHCFGASS